MTFSSILTWFLSAYNAVASWVSWVGLYLGPLLTQPFSLAVLIFGTVFTVGYNIISFMVSHLSSIQPITYALSNTVAVSPSFSGYAMGNAMACLYLFAADNMLTFLWAALQVHVSLVLYRFAKSWLENGW